MEIIRLTPDDAERFLAMRRLALDGDAQNFRGASVDDAALGLQAWRDRLARDHVVALEADGAWLAVGGLTRFPGVKLDHKGLIWGMYAVPAARGTGAAARILDALEQAARAMPLRQLQLTLMADNLRARRLYERHGFELYAIEPDSVCREDGYADEALMWKRL
ncbi:GNAT family N-acetyltransferase [Novosphingobium olei]|uniref:GNAT family N-acetyltransferase n=1 Tax=Novosphingobium olei TaxID=2728851 RepID=A0A7Y0BPQ7_9SPHN|nr:GNAT family N-acetyltransferase [Novosphingobium olei]NML94203.1 GNAT family N-acetyltransferase [Novosphingobium olei]